MAERFALSTSKSLVWHYFKISSSDECKATCIICNVAVSRGKHAKPFTTTNFRKHLKAKHSITEVMHPKPIEPSPSNSGPTSSTSSSSTIKTPEKQLTLKEVFQRNAPFPSGHPVSERITKVLHEMIAINLLPLSFVETEGFKRLMAEIQPKCCLPSRKMMTKTIVPNTYTLVKKQIKIALWEFSFSYRCNDGYSL